MDPDVRLDFVSSSADAAQRADNGYEPNIPKRYENSIDSTPPAKEEPGPSNIPYVIMLGISVVLGVVLKFSVAKNIRLIFSFIGFCISDKCAGDQIIYRMSFGSCIFFLVMMGLTRAFGAAAHGGWWCVKSLLYTISLGCSFLISAEFFAGYAEVARVASMFFLVLQIIILIDMIYDLHEYLLDDSGHEATARNKTCYLVLSVVTLVCGLLGTILLFSFYGGCEVNIALIVTTLVLGLFCICLCITKLIDKGLLVPSFVFFYCVFICWQALSSNPELACNPFQGQKADLGMTILSAIVTVISITWASWSAAKQAEHVLVVNEEHAQNVSIKKRHWYFHMVMAMGAMYSAMLFTNWGVDRGEENEEVPSTSFESMWIKVGSFLITYLLFIWTMLAPVCCKSRDFSDSHNQFRS